MMSSSHILGTGNLFDCDGLIAVITGGGSGLGLIMAQALACNGATVFILGRRLDKIESAALSFSSTTESNNVGKLIPLQCDVTSKSSLLSATSHIAQQIGYVNLVIANAGIVGPDNRSLLPREAKDQRGPLTIAQVQESLWDMPLEGLMDTYAVNVIGAMNTTVAFLELLDKGNTKGNVIQKSQVLITSSIGGFHRSWPQAGIGYTTSKAAVNHLVKNLASFLIEWKIRVNGLAPGLFPSEMTAAVFGDKDITVEGALPKWLQPMERAGNEKEIAGAVLYFASQAGAYCSGSIHVIDGGRLGSLPGATY